MNQKNKGGFFFFFFLFPSSFTEKTAPVGEVLLKCAFQCFYVHAIVQFQVQHTSHHLHTRTHVNCAVPQPRLGVFCAIWLCTHWLVGWSFAKKRAGKGGPG